MSEEYVFNGSMATLERIDSLLMFLHASNINGTHIQTIKYLDSLYKEAYPLLKKDEKEEGDILRQNLYNSITTNSDGNLQIKESGFIHIHKFDFWIRNKLNQYGLLMKKGDYAGHSIG